VTEHQVSVVVPVYRGERHLPGLVAEVAELTETQRTADGRDYRVVEMILVHDCGPDHSDRVIRELAEKYEWVRPVWLSRNYGQHAATLAGMASSSGEWIVTLDEDGQHDPSDIGSLLDAALQHGASLVYAAPTNPAPHPAFRRLTSKFSKRVITLLSPAADASLFHSFRLVLGEVGRSVAAYAGQGVYLDVALSWVARSPATAPVTLRDEGERQSGYNPRTLASHFWRMVLTSGTKGLRMVSLLGVLVAVAGFVLAVVLVILRFTRGADVQGWTSLIVVTLLCSGAVLFALGVIAEYVGVAVNMAMGKPLYLITSDPATGPLGRQADRDPR
jgi:undecaprenyl-phosphate 4-deoxy-4-formamido-L-arabinose transferase